MHTITVPRWASFFAILAAFAFCAHWSPPARAGSALFDDQSDLWWVASESGWGIQFIHRGNTIFATTFIYDAAFKPTWVVATLKPIGNSWTGDVIVTTGSPYGAPTWDPTAVTGRKAGAMTWTPETDGATGSLAYSIDGTNLQKTIARQTIEFDDFSGRYGGMLSVSNTCRGVREDFVEIVVTQVGRLATINLDNRSTLDNCSYAGTLTQNGQFGTLNGSFECGPIHDDGTFFFEQMSVTPTSLVARYRSVDGDTGCKSTGYIGLARHR
jgi:hypothetical protein